MREILQELNQEVGVKGSLVLTGDGMVMMAEVGANLDSEAVAANASATLQILRSGLKQIDVDGFSRFVCNAAFGKLVFVTAGEPYLAVVLDKSINLDYTMMAVTSAATRIKSALTL